LAGSNLLGESHGIAPASGLADQTMAASIDNASALLGIPEQSPLLRIAK
jgi:hypothetical protein